MSGYRSKFFRFDCVRDGCLQDTLPSWDWMHGSFPRGIMPTDVDGMVEINGNILFIEQKGAGCGFKGGQLAAFRSLSRKPGITVYGIRPAGDSFERIILDGREPQGWQPRSTEQMRTELTSWSTSAERP